jgi:hypothetical protein
MDGEAGIDWKEEYTLEFDDGAEAVAGYVFASSRNPS